MAPVLADSPATVPPRIRRAGDPGINLDLQRLLLGPGVVLNRSKTSHHISAGEPAGPILHQPEPDSRRRPDDRGTHTDRVPVAATALHPRPDTRCQQGLTAYPQSPHLT